MSAYGLVAMLAYFPGGWLADKYPAKILMIVSLVATGLLGLWISTFPSYPILLLIYILWGVSITPVSYTHLDVYKRQALYHHYGVPKHNLDHKLFGVFEHHLEEKYIPLFRGFDDTFYVPHSRHSEVRREDIEKVPELSMMAMSDEAGVYLSLIHI